MNTSTERGDAPDRALEREADELEEGLYELGGDIDEARDKLRARREDADVGEEVAGDWEDTDDEGGGEDPAAFDDPERAALEEDEEES